MLCIPFEKFHCIKMEGHLDPLKTPGAQEISCHFSGNDPNVLKRPDFFKNDVGPKVKESFWAYIE